MTRKIVWPLLFIAGFALCAAPPEFHSVHIDENGQLHIVLGSGKEILPAKKKWQTSFDQPAVSPDHHTVGWLVMGPDPTIFYYKGAQLPFELALYRGRRILHTFKSDQVFWDWRFEDDGRKVAYSEGPTHGGAEQCLLRDVDSGRILARWLPKEGGDPPDWAKTLHY